MENTYVWNSKVKYIRSGEEKFDNLKECLENNKYMYIGRRGIVFIKTETGKERFPKTDSVWANPYKVGKDGTLDEVLEKYEQYIKNKIIRILKLNI